MKAKTCAFSALVDQSADALLALTGQYRADKRHRKLDLGVGVYCDETGNTPIMAAIKQAELVLHRDQVTKSYLAPKGDVHYVSLLANLVFGNVLASDPCLTGCKRHDMFRGVMAQIIVAQHAKKDAARIVEAYSMAFTRGCPARRTIGGDQP
jgi:hypothetical protein